MDSLFIKSWSLWMSFHLRIFGHMGQLSFSLKAILSDLTDLDVNIHSQLCGYQIFIMHTNSSKGHSSEITITCKLWSFLKNYTFSQTDFLIVKNPNLFTHSTYMSLPVSHMFSPRSLQFCGIRKITWRYYIFVVIPKKDNRK